jgi:hypothetical protein
MESIKVRGRSPTEGTSILPPKALDTDLRNRKNKEIPIKTILSLVAEQREGARLLCSDRYSRG